MSVLKPVSSGKAPSAATICFLLSSLAAGSSNIQSERLEVLSQGQEYAFFGKALYQGKNIEIRADELRSRETEGALIARGHVRILRKSPEGEWIATGEKARYNLKKGAGEMSGNVKVIRRPASSRNANVILLCRRLEIYDEGKRLMAFGNVRFAEEYLLGKAPRARYDEDSQEILLEGGASLEKEVSGQRRLLEANRMWIHLNSKKHRSEGKSRLRIWER